MALPKPLQSHPRLFLAFAFGAIVAAIIPASIAWPVRLVAAWDLAATLYLVLAWRMMLTADDASMRRRACIQDESGWTILAVSAVASAVSLCAVVGVLTGAKTGGVAQMVHLGLAIYTIFSAWFFLHTLFALHYAHFYYGDPDGSGPQGRRGGLEFQGNPKNPGYTDFAYFAFTVGMTAQTADTGISSSRMRTLTLAHAIFTFFFNTAIVALTINIVAGLI